MNISLYYKSFKKKVFVKEILHKKALKIIFLIILYFGKV